MCDLSDLSDMVGDGFHQVFFSVVETGALNLCVELP